MKLPNYEKAYIDINKLKGYCLNTTHETGKHKARLFSSILGLTIEDAEKLKYYILEAIKTHNAKFTEEDIYGKRFLVEFKIRTSKGDAKIRSTWIIKTKENFPRLTSCYILKER